VTRKGVYRVVSITEGGRQCFSVTVAEDDGASERRLPMSFNTRADAEETVAYLKRSIAWPRQGTVVARGRNRTLRSRTSAS
jgi:hypothetical protein